MIKNFVVNLKNSAPLMGKQYPSFGYKNLKKVEPESFVVIKSDIKSNQDYHDKVEVKKYIRRDFRRGLDEDDVPIPVSPQFAPYRVKKTIL